MMAKKIQFFVITGSKFAKQENFFSAVFSKQFFHQKGTHKELQVKGNLLDCSQILTVASFTYKHQNRVSEFFISKYFFFQERFLYDHSTFF